MSDQHARRRAGAARIAAGLFADRRAAGAVFARLQTMLATSAKDWAEYRVDAWLWGVLCGWECEDHHPGGVHDDVCGGADGAMPLVAARHGWTDQDVALLREHRSVVRVLQADAVRTGACAAPGS